MTSRIIHVKKTVITFTCHTCWNTHPDPKSAKLCHGYEEILPEIDPELDKLVNDLVEEAYKDMPVTPLYRK